MQERWAGLAQSNASCCSMPLFGELLGSIESRIALAKSPYGQDVCEATQVARRYLTTVFIGRTGNINLSTTGNPSNSTSICRVFS